MASGDWYLSPAEMSEHPEVTDGESPENIREQLIYGWRNKVSETVICSLRVKKKKCSLLLGTSAICLLQCLTSDVPLSFQVSRGSNDSTGLWGNSWKQDPPPPPSPPLLPLLQLPKQVGLQVGTIELSEMQQVVTMTSDSMLGIFHVAHRYSPTSISRDRDVLRMF